MEKLTVNSVKNFDSEVDYTTVLDNFEGPLDLLLHLIKQSDINICDISILDITKQYMEYINKIISISQIFPIL